MAEADGQGMVTVRSRHTADETVARVRAALQAKGIREFALIDHSGEARAAGLTMPATQVLVFGNPVVGTTLMLERPSVALDLPLKSTLR